MSYRFGKVFWDYDPCEGCMAEDCKSCEYYFEEDNDDND